MIIFFAALIAILYHVGIMQAVIKWIGGALEKITGISKVESLSAASNIFVGQSGKPAGDPPLCLPRSPLHSCSA